MSEFKVGDIVECTIDSSVGKLVHYDAGGWWVLWTHGFDVGEEWWVREKDIALFHQTDENILTLAKSMCTYTTFSTSSGEGYGFSEEDMVRFARTLLERHSNESNQGRSD